jgi:signal transduction histidine kinase
VKPANKPHIPVLSSTVFGLTAWTAAAFFLAASVLLGFLFWRTNALLIDQVVSQLQREADGLRQEFVLEGWQRVVYSIARRSEAETDSLYYLQAPSGRRVGGNLQAAPGNLSQQEPGGVFQYLRQTGSGETEQRSAVAVRVGFGDGAVAYIGRDIEDTEDFARWVRTFFLTGFGLLSLAAMAGSYAISRLVLRRIGDINATAQSIMEGDLSQRIPVTGSGDELDDLGNNLNSMLDRIEQLMHSLREVSDNIAHDLKTPLNRLRNRAEGALRDPGGEVAYREGLERTLEEADGLIRTFNALLLIARLEAGAIEKTAVTFDIAAVAADVGEFYEPVAEEHEMRIDYVSHGPVEVHANKQLIGQAIANLIDNAIKYGHQGRQGDGDAKQSLIRVETSRDGDGAFIKVCDHGPGIEAEDRKRVLNRFVRLQQSRTAPGTGLGLSLVAAVARMHKGTVDLSDNEPGLCVTLRLPRQAGQKEVSAEEGL